MAPLVRRADFQPASLHCEEDPDGLIRSLDGIHSSDSVGNAGRRERRCDWDCQSSSNRVPPWRQPPPAIEIMEAIMQPEHPRSKGRSGTPATEESAKASLPERRPIGIVRVSHCVRRYSRDMRRASGDLR